jgi:hypothetical protein
MHYFLHILKTLGPAHHRRFWLTWFTITIVSLIYVVSTIGRSRKSKAKGEEMSSPEIGSSGRRIWNAENFVSIIAITTFLVLYILMLFVWEDFAYYDNDLLILYSVKGHGFPPPIWKGNGRFFPFGLIEYNVVSHFTKTPIGYQTLPAIQVLIVFGILLILDSQLSVRWRATLAIIALLTPSVYLSFASIILEERNVLFCLSLLLLSVRQFERSKALFSAVAAILCAQIMLYFKEVGFLLLGAFAVGRVLLRCMTGHHGRWQFDYGRLWRQESRLDLCLASLALLFLVSYFIVMGIHGNIDYAIQAAHPTREVLRHYLQVDLLLWVFLAVVFGRAYLIFRHLRLPWLFWDPLALGGVAWFLAYVRLSMFTAYYMAPVDLIAVLYVGRTVFLSWRESRPWIKVTVVILAFSVLTQDVALTSFAVIERKNIIHAKAEIASVVKRRYLNGDGTIPKLFFPFGRAYRVMEFIVYLNYRGVPVDTAILSHGPIAKDGRCLEYRNVRCRPALEPGPGDLVIILPDDNASLADSSVYRRQGEVLFSYDPCPSIPHWLYPFFGDFPLAAGLYNKTRPDGWMHASVTVWR